VTAGAVVAAAYGVHLTYTGLALGWRGVGVGPARQRRVAWSLPISREVVVAVAFVGAVSGAVAYAAFGGVLPAVAATVFGATFPIASSRRRRAARLEAAQEAWPRLLEELRVRTGALGRSIPQALFEVGRHAPAALRPAFDAAHREWMISTDFERTVAVLKEGLADPTGDAVGETLLVAHEIGGSDLDRRLAALVADRTEEVQGRKDAAAKQAGVRFARRFVLLVPAGMAAAGMSVGNGRAAYTTDVGQVAVVAGITLVALCWLWAGRMLHLPVQERVFGG
jgi:tight adherence protein B